MNNNDIVRSLEMIATLMQIKDEAYYRWLGYQRAAESVQALGRPVTEVDDLKTLPQRLPKPEPFRAKLDALKRVLCVHGLVDHEQ